MKNLEQAVQNLTEILAEEAKEMALDIVKAMSFEEDNNVETNFECDFDDTIDEEYDYDFDANVPLSMYKNMDYDDDFIDLDDEEDYQPKRMYDYDDFHRTLKLVFGETYEEDEGEEIDLAEDLVRKVKDFKARQIKPKKMYDYDAQFKAIREQLKQTDRLMVKRENMMNTIADMRQFTYEMMETLDDMVNELNMLEKEIDKIGIRQ